VVVLEPFGTQVTRRALLIVSTRPADAARRRMYSAVRLADRIIIPRRGTPTPTEIMFVASSTSIERGSPSYFSLGNRKLLMIDEPIRLVSLDLHELTLAEVLAAGSPETV
jgi:hypothetical protein